MTHSRQIAQLFQFSNINRLFEERLAGRLRRAEIGFEVRAALVERLLLRAQAQLALQGGFVTFTINASSSNFKRANNLFVLGGRLPHLLVVIV